MICIAALRHLCCRQGSLTKAHAPHVAYIQDQASQCVAAYMVEPADGSVPPKGTTTVRVTLRTSRLGRIQLPLYVRTAGSRAPPLQLTLNVRSLGPALQFATAAALAAAARTQHRASLVAHDGTAGGGGWPAGRRSTVVGKSMAGGAGVLEAGGPPETTGAPGSEVSSASVGSAGRPPKPEVSSVSMGSSGHTGGDHRGEAGSVAGSAVVRSTAGITPSAAGGQQHARARASAAGAAKQALQLPPSPWQPGASISFDKVAVLTPVTRELRVRNLTVIPAQAKLFIEGTNSVFEVHEGTGGQGGMEFNLLLSGSDLRGGQGPCLLLSTSAPTLLPSFFRKCAGRPTGA